MKYAVFGNPIEHSKSPAIHAAFARQTGVAMTYERILAPRDGFAAAVRDFVAVGGRGASVTAPFKGSAVDLCTHLSQRACIAEAVNTLIFDRGRLRGDNTDGIGLVRALGESQILGARTLVLGAGGAARGILLDLLDCRPAEVMIANRDAIKARRLAAMMAMFGRVSGGGLDEIDGGFDLVINATSASLVGELPPLPPGCFAAGSLAYDMMYGKGETPFMAFARVQGAGKVADGLGMLVEQAAEAFDLWTGERPDAPAVLAALRAGLCSN